MAQLREIFKKEAMENLNNSGFSSSDFFLEEPLNDQTDTNNRMTLLIIRFRYHPEYRFIIDSYIDSGQHTKFALSESPGDGELNSSEEYSIASAKEGISRIPAWVERVREDFDAMNPSKTEIERKIEELRQELESELLEMEEKEQESFFSNEEAQNIRETLDSVVSRLEKLEKAEEKNSISDEALEAFRKEIEILKQGASKYPKGVWLRMRNSKIARFIVENSSGTAIKEITKTVLKLLGNGD